MRNTMRSEFIKIRTVLANWVLVVVALAFPLVVTTLVAIFGDTDFGPSSDEVAGLVTGLAVVSAMILGALSAISLTGDYGHATIRPTYAATPNRSRVIGAKLVVNTSLIGLLAAIAVFGSWLSASLILATRDASISLTDDDVLASLVSVIVLAIAVGLFGFGLGLVIRNSPVTITVLLLWPLLIEGLLALALTLLGADGAVRWLPYQAAIQAVGDDGGNNGDAVLGRPWGLVYFAAVAAVITAVGTLLDHRRDA